jgi:integrase
VASPSLSTVAIARIKKPGKHAVGDGAYLQISAAGTRAWLFRYERDGKGHWMGLGPCSLITLAEARAKARDARRSLLEGADPLDLKRQRKTAARLASATSVTFKDAAERMIASMQAGWKNPKHRAQWTATLETYVYPSFGSLPVAAVDTGLVLKAVEPIWTKKAETASRVRGRIEAVLDWAKARGYREGENPARWRGHLDKLLPAQQKVRTVRNHPALPWAEIPAFVAELGARLSASAKALELLILTAARTSEIIEATWYEVDLDKAVWTIPADRMKAEKEHRVPLSPAALDLLRSLPRENGTPYLFLGGRRGKPLSNMAMLELMRGMRPGYVPHGLRSSFRDWASEATNHQKEVVEMALAHAIESKVEAAYRRGDLFEKRRKLMDDWARFCGGVAPCP